jgi:2-dehydro-3-deoxyphosphogluconate aldolase / (4S)-4-hydroxy-2-oxoglutarate aldolase
MHSQQAYDMIEQTKIVAGMRGAFAPPVALDVAEALMDAGVTCFELTMNSEQPIAAMQAIKAAYGDKACVGMGTVLDPQTAQRVLDAGADFVVSPAFQPEVVQVVLDVDILVAPGVITPSEAVAAWGMGVKLLKLFPIGPLGLDYFKAVTGPLNHMKFMCNGGMTAENAGEFIGAGAVACGMASWLTGKGTFNQDVIATRARQLHRVIDAAQGKPRTI